MAKKKGAKRSRGSRPREGYLPISGGPQATPSIGQVVGPPPALIKPADPRFIPNWGSQSSGRTRAPSNKAPNVSVPRSASGTTGPTDPLIFKPGTKIQVPKGTRGAEPQVNPGGGINIRISPIPSRDMDESTIQERGGAGAPPFPGRPGTFDKGTPGRWETIPQRGPGRLLETERDPVRIYVPGQPEREFQGPIDTRVPGEIEFTAPSTTEVGVYYFDKGRFLTRGRYGKTNAATTQRRG